jgi:hypothetical protein
MIQESNIVPLFKTFEELQRDEQEIIADFNAEIDAAQKLLDLTFTALRQDTEALRKFDSADQALAKATADRLIADNRGRPALAKVDPDTIVALAKFDAKTVALTAVRDALLKRNHRIFGHDALSRRSARHTAAVAWRRSK